MSRSVLSVRPIRYNVSEDGAFESVTASEYSVEFVAESGYSEVQKYIIQSGSDENAILDEAEADFLEARSAIDVEPISTPI